MSQPQNLPELLQAKLKLALVNWARRTVIWTGILGLLSAMAPGIWVFLIAWLVFSAFSLAALLFGLKLAKNLKTGTASGFPQGMHEPRDVGGTRPDSIDEEDPAPHHGHSGRNAVNDEIIEIEAEVLPPESGPPRR
jgi:hypothetical protein